MNRTTSLNTIVVVNFIVKCMEKHERTSDHYLGTRELILQEIKKKIVSIYLIVIRMYKRNVCFLGICLLSMVRIMKRDCVCLYYNKIDKKSVRSLTAEWTKR